MRVRARGVRDFGRVLRRGVHTIRLVGKGGAGAAGVAQAKVRLAPCNAMAARRRFRMRVWGAGRGGC